MTGRGRGVLNPRIVRGIASVITLVCIVVAVLAALLAIWEFSGTDTMWRTVASCAVIGSGSLLFAVVNTLLGAPEA